MSLGSVEATETRSGGGRFTLFTSDSRLDAAAGVEGRLGVRLSETLQAEAAGSYTKPTLVARIGSDAEGIPDVTVPETITQFAVEGAILLDLSRFKVGTRGVPFVSAGAGYNRQLHETATLIEHGIVYHIGGGANVALKVRPDRALKTFGLRLDARAIIRTGGIAFDNNSHAGASFGGTLFVRF
jgi:hypothetical protein